MKIKLYQRDRMIYFRLAEGKTMVRLTTGIKLPKNSRFIQTREIISGKTYDVECLNASLLKMKADISELYISNNDLQYIKSIFSKKEEVVTNTLINMRSDTDMVKIINWFIEDLYNGKYERYRGSKIKDSTKYNYQISLMSYKTYLRMSKQTINIDDFKLDGKELVEKKSAEHKMINHFADYDDWNLELGKKINTRANLITAIELLMAYYSSETLSLFPKIKRIKREENPIITLDERFVRNFVTDRFEKYNKMSPFNKLMWEVYVIQLSTSLRISDALSLTVGDFIEQNGVLFLNKENQKTGEMSTLPLPESLESRLRLHIKKYRRVYSYICRSSIQSLNEKFRLESKNFWGQYPEMRELVTFKKSNARGEKKSITKPWYEWIHSHMLRKTAITLMLANGVSEKHVKFASGHSANSKSFERYSGWVDRTHKSEMENYHNKVFKPNNKKPRKK